MQQCWRWLCHTQFYIVMVFFTHLSLTDSPGKTIPLFNDWLMHAVGYAIAACSLTVAYPLMAHSYRLGSLLLYSTLIEVLQHFNPPRTFDWMDIVANGIGILIGLMLITFARRCALIKSLLLTGKC